MKYSINIKRIYEQPNENDGYRILVDRLWPRGVKKEDAKLNEWNKKIAPSNELRVWFAHKPENFESFSECYREELAKNTDELKRITKIAENKNVTLLYGAKSPEINHAKIISEAVNAIRK